eukprot:gene14966-biopygen4081
MDRQFEFRNASIEQVRAMFCRFMEGTRVRRGGAPARAATAAEVDAAAAAFTRALSDCGAEGARTQFSLAQVQGLCSY